ncbi:hypothetical protein [Polycladidibacter stylochi]|uniref:hypothetical protein n=1 Tax=Polycladidibacter stylochi TaxID=1807766 RepID=UPI00083678B4|nr:hypothetical protein [Pseudovibrio stylochi]
MQPVVLEFEPIGNAAVRVVEELGLGERFRYWHGESGKKYLFTQSEPEALVDCPSAVVLICCPQDDYRVVWLGESASGDFQNWSPTPDDLDHVRLYAHFLAVDSKSRQKALDDLTAKLHCNGDQQAA